MNRSFKNLVSYVMSTLAISAFAKDAQGHSFLTADQREALTKRYGELFVTGFSEDLKKAEQEAGISAEEIAASLTADERKAEEKENKEIIKLRDDNEKLLAQVDKLRKSPVEDKPEELAGAHAPAPRTAFVPDMSMVHNRYYVAAANGDAWTGDDTVDTTELKKEFGKYVSSEKQQIFQKLVGKLVCTQYMSSIITDKFEVRASSSEISSVLQTFTPQFTPKGKTKFTPLTIKSYPMKINHLIYPSDIINDVIGYLYDENLEPKDMPIVKYIVVMKLKPKLDEERELALAVGRYVEPTQDEHGNYIANESNQVCDGYLTQLCDLKKAKDTDVTWLLDGTADLAAAPNIVELMEQAMDSVKPLYKNQKMYVHIDPDLLLKYQRQYRAKYPYSKNEDGQRTKVDFTKFDFAEIEGMRGTGAFFLTPKSNFKHILSRSPQQHKLRMESQDYSAKIFGEWREGTGFWIKEAVFAYLPTALVEKLSPTVLAAAADDAGFGA